MTKIVGITGGIAQGKSNVANVLASRGFSVVYADTVAHRSYEPGTECFRQLVDTFGEDIVGADGYVNRRALGGKVFADKSVLKLLNEIVWPATRALLVADIEALRSAGVNTVFLEAAVLLEAGWHTICDEVWTVTCKPALQLERLMKRNSLSREAAQARVDSQSPDVERISAATRIVTNNGTIEELAQQVDTVVAAAGLSPGTSTPSTEEFVWHVDEMNNVMGAVPRSRMRRENLWHRATYILVENSKGELYVQVRTTTKDYCPGYHDVVTGGVVAAGEEYDASAKRELEEELGVTGVPLQYLFTFPYEGERSRVWGAGFYVQYDGDIVPQESEVQRVEMMTIPEIHSSLASGTKFTPDSMHFLHLYQCYVNTKGHPVKRTASPPKVLQPPPPAGGGWGRLIVPAVAVAAIGIAVFMARR